MSLVIVAVLAALVGLIASVAVQSIYRKRLSFTDRTRLGWASLIGTIGVLVAVTYQLLTKGEPESTKWLTLTGLIIGSAPAIWNELSIRQKDRSS